jgi:[ribosomal protein S5]-alanine N-acetyltransferase
METQRTILKKLTRKDFDDYFNLYGNEDVMRLITGKAYTRDEAKRKFKNAIEINLYIKDIGYFGIYLRKTEEFIGIGKIVMTTNDEAEIGYVFLPEYWNQGFGGEVSEKLVSHAKNIPEIDRLIAIIDPENMASKKILLKSGFSLDKVCTIDNLPAEIFKLIIS